MPRLDRTLTASFFVALVPAFLAGACATATTASISDSGGTETSGDTGGTASGGYATSGGTSSASGASPTGGSTSATGGTTSPTGGTTAASGGRATGGSTSPTGGTTSPTGGKATGGTTSPTGGSTSSPTGGTGVTATGGTAVVSTGGVPPAATGGTAPTATGGTGGSGPSNSVALLAGGYYQMSTTYFGYCWTGHDSVSTITPPCGGGTNPCFTPATGVCASGTIAQDSAPSYANWGIAVGCNIAQPQSAGTAAPPTTTLPLTATIHVTLSANTGTTLPAILRVQVGDGSGTTATTYCATLTLTGGSGSVAVSSLKTSCWDTTGTAITASTPVANVQVEAVSNLTAAQPFNFCISALTIS